MASYKNKSGINVVIKIGLDELERIKDQTGITLQQITEFGTSNSYELGDPIKLLRVLIAVIQPDNIDDFKASIDDGDICEKAADALLDAVLDFLPRQQRSQKQLAVSKLRAAKPQIQAALARATSSLTPAALLKQMDKTIGALGLSGTSPASPESPPVDSESAT